MSKLAFEKTAANLHAVNEGRKAGSKFAKRYTGDIAAKKSDVVTLLSTWAQCEGDNAKALAKAQADATKLFSAELARVFCKEAETALGDDLAFHFKDGTGKQAAQSYCSDVKTVALYLYATGSNIVDVDAFPAGIPLTRKAINALATDNGVDIGQGAGKKAKRGARNTTAKNGAPTGETIAPVSTPVTADRLEAAYNAIEAIGKVSRPIVEAHDVAAWRAIDSQLATLQRLIDEMSGK